jgi:hypothetical protein
MERPNFDAAAEAFAKAATRREALKILGRGSLAMGVWALINPATAEAKEACRAAGRKCNKTDKCCSGVCCGGVCCAAGQICSNGHCTAPPPPPPPGTDHLTCYCNNGKVLDFCTTVDCFDGQAQDAICGPQCEPYGGEQATGCPYGDPVCAA